MENPFKWRHFQPEIILLTVRWYLRYSLSYRDLEEMMAERGLSVDHTTIYRWVQEYAPEIDKRSRPYLETISNRVLAGIDQHSRTPSFGFVPTSLPGAMPGYQVSNLLRNSSFNVLVRT
jgi:hypothetical protein